jgi:hypothetical protein
VRSKRVIGWIVLGAVVAGAIAFALSAEELGLGSFDQPVVVVAAAPIKRVSYCCCEVDDVTRRHAEHEADPESFVFSEATHTIGNRFLAHIRFTTRSGWFRKAQVYYPGQLVVYVEFENAARACRVVDLPSGRGQEEVVVHLP